MLLDFTKRAEDRRREQRIAAMAKDCKFGSREERREKFRAMAAEIKLRSPAQVARMERARGL